MSSNFNFYVNRQGVQGKRGAKGEQGFSPVISVESQTANEYILKVENEDGSFTTPNLRGNAIENNGGTYVRFNPETEQMYTGYADGATTEQAGVVRMGTYEDLVAGESEELVPNVADVHNYVQNSIGDIGGVVTTEQFNTYTSETAITLDNLSNNKLDKSTFDSYTSATNSTLESLSTNKVNVSDYTTFVNNTNSTLSDLSTNKLDTSTFDSFASSTSSTLNTLNTEKLDFTDLANSLVQGENVTLTKDTANKTITISGSGGSKVQSNWTETDSTNPSFIQNKPTLGTMASEDASDYTPSAGLSDVAISGSYNDLLNKPTIPAAQVNADWNATSGVSQILNKPTLFSGDYNDLTNKPDIPAAANDATITITQGGVTKGSFTTNQSSNATIDIDAVSSSLSAGNGIDINTSDEIDIMQEDIVDSNGTYQWDVETTGSPTINDGVYSNLSSSNYFSTKTYTNPTSSFEYQIKFRTSSLNNNMDLCRVGTHAWVQVRRTDLSVYIWNGTSMSQSFSGRDVFIANTDYLLNVTWDGTKITTTLTDLADNTVMYTRNFNASAMSWDGNLIFGSPDPSSGMSAFNGSIDLNYSYIKVNSTLFSGITPSDPIILKEVAKATNSLYGLVKPDNNTITVSNGVIEVDQSALTSKQDTLVSGTSIKTINSTSLLGSGDVSVQPTLVSGTNIKTINGTSVLGSGDIATGNVQSTTVNNIVQITQADYDALATKDPNTQYIITDAPSLALADLSNVTDQAKILMGGMAMPSDKYIDLTLGADGSTYTAPANGWFVVSKRSTGADQILELTSTSTGLGFKYASTGAQGCTVSCPVKKSDIIRLGYTVTGETKFFRFIYAVGSESEVQ